MKATDINLREMLAFEPDAGKLLLGADRMLLFRQEAFAFLRKLLFEQLGDITARALIMQFGHRCGAGDYVALNQQYTWDSEQDQLGCGPVMHSWEGIVHVEPVHMEFDRETGHFLFRGIWRNSYEAEIHIQQFGVQEHPVCYSLTGYASGWCSEFFGAPLLAVEEKCVGKGDERCEWSIKPIGKWGPDKNVWKDALSARVESIAAQLEHKVAIIDEQRQKMAEMAAPVIQVWEGVIALPVIGTVDQTRAQQMMESLLTEIVERSARWAILDLTGVDHVDTNTANHLMQVFKAVQLLGSQCLVSGISPDIARTFSQLGVELTIRTYSNLQTALQYAINASNAGKKGVTG